MNSRSSAHGAYGTKRNRLSAETVAKSRFSDPVYYVFDNRRRGAAVGPVGWDEAP